ncbi:MAG: hypothetical protein U5L11_17090 [Arhodomonas sp.]|nr:hypothetical protein [Arhodomonas sp.]
MTRGRRRRYFCASLPPLGRRRSAGGPVAGIVVFDVSGDDPSTLAGRVDDALEAAHAALEEEAAVAPGGGLVFTHRWRDGLLFRIARITGFCGPVRGSRRLPRSPAGVGR